jgi:hypothetical protein
MLMGDSGYSAAWEEGQKTKTMATKATSVKP